MGSRTKTRCAMERAMRRRLRRIDHLERRGGSGMVERTRALFNSALSWFEKKFGRMPGTSTLKTREA